MNRRIVILIGIIFVVAAFLRFYKIDAFMTFLGDQGRDAIVVKRILMFEHFPAIGAASSVGNIFLGPFYYYLIAPFLLIFNFNPVGLGLGVAILALLAMMYIAYEMYKEYGGFITVIFLYLMTFSFSLIDLSRFSWNPNLLPYFSFIALFFFYKWITHNSWRFAVLCGSFLTFAFQLHYLALLIFIPIGFYYVYALLTTNKKLQLIKQTVLAIGAFIFFTLPLILFDIKNNFLNSGNFLKLLTGENISTDSSYMARFQETITAFIHHTLQLQVSFPWALSIIIIFIIGSFFIIKKLKHPFITLNSIVVLSYLISFAFLSGPRYIHYFTPVYVSFYFVISFFVLLIPKRIFQFIAAVPFIFIFILLQTPNYYFMTENPSYQIRRAKQVAESFKPHIQQQPIQIVALPFKETDGHYRYFLELNGYEVLALDSPHQAEELYVMCFDEENCRPLDDPHWQIAAFYNKALDLSWQSEGVTIYKVIHKND